ncbi:MAG TPA: DUF2398 family protein [Streptosporangiaceae bacterium]|nr:DUF2398 family protein [Streptosporangiaceae bacterium]
MAPPGVAAGVAQSDLGSYQQAVRLVLTHDVITATRPRPGVLQAVLRWADELTKDFRELLGYTLIATTRQVRLVRRLDELDATQGPMFAKNGKPFDRRRLAYLCLVLASFQRSRVEISLADLVRAFTPAANAIDGLGFDARVTAHKAAVVDVLDWLVERGALGLSDGSLEAWAQDSERGDALYDIDHDICASLFKPARPLQHLTSAAGLLDAPFVASKRGAQRAAAEQRAARALLEYPVVYFAQVEPEIADALRARGVAEHLARLTGMPVERRAEGVMLADSGGRFTDKPFPGRGGAVNRAAGLLLAKIADLIEDRDQALTRFELPPDRQDQRDLLARIDSALPVAGVVHELAWSVPTETQDGEKFTGLTVGTEGPVTPDGVPPTTAPLIEHSTLATMIAELYDELGPASFTITWQHDPHGLLAAATAFLADLRLLRPVEGGVLVLPAAARYRNIKLALPITRAGDGQLAMSFGGFQHGGAEEAT